MTKEKKEESGADMFEQKGKSAQLPQYDDITIRRMEAINAKANLRTWLVFNKSGLYGTLAAFHNYFGALVDSTILEITESDKRQKPHLDEDDQARIHIFLEDPFKNLDIKGGDMESKANRAEISKAAREAIQIHDLYEVALKKGGFRKISYAVLKDEHKWRENI